MKKHIVTRMTSENDLVWTLEVAPGLVVFKHTRYRSKNAKRVSTEVIQAFTTSAALKRFQSGKDKDLKGSGHSLVTPAFIENMQKHGWPQSDHGGFPWTYSMMEKGISKVPYDDIVRGWKADQVIKLNNWNNTMSDRFDKHMPVGIWFGLGSGNVDDRHMDLKKAVAVLLKNPAVTMFKPSRPWRSASEGDDGEYIHLPVGDSDMSYLVFVWAPTQRQYDRVWAVAGEKGWTDRHKIIHDLDYLGLVKAKVADKEYYGQRFQREECA